MRKEIFKNLKKVLDNLLALCYDKLPATGHPVRACTLKIKQCKKLKSFLSTRKRELEKDRNGTPVLSAEMSSSIPF